MDRAGWVSDFCLFCGGSPPWPLARYFAAATQGWREGGGGVGRGAERVGAAVKGTRPGPESRGRGRPAGRRAALGATGRPLPSWRPRPACEEGRLRPGTVLRS